MSDNAGYRPHDESALRWEDVHCDGCGHHDRYHFEDGEGNIVCRYEAGCVCVRAAVPQTSQRPEDL